MTKKSKRSKRTRLPPAPRYLSAGAAKIWRSVIAYLRANGRLEAVDVGVVEMYCQAIVRQRALQAEIDRAGVMCDGKLHPALRTIEATAASIRSAAHCLGLTPAARKALPTRIKQPRLEGNSKGTDPWHGVLEE